MMIPIHAEHSNWTVVHKPAGIAVHNTEGGAHLLDLLLEQTGTDWKLVHRLDKATSGLLVLAKDAHWTHKLQQAMEGAHKSYAAIVRGAVSFQATDWRQSLSNNAEGARNPQGKSAQRVHAHTHVLCVDKNAYLSALRLQLHTGRQHQIRKHAVLNRHAVIGDTRYGDKRYNDMIVKRYGFEGMALHAERLSFELDGKAHDFHAPIPEQWGCLALSWPAVD